MWGFVRVIKKSECVGYERSVVNFGEKCKRREEIGKEKKILDCYEVLRGLRGVGIETWSSKSGI